MRAYGESCEICLVDDELKDAAQASVPVVNAGALRLSVFEGIRCYATEHVRRCFVWKSTWTGCSTQLTLWLPRSAVESRRAD